MSLDLYSIPKLGFGCMRLPLLDDGTVNIDIFTKMVDYFMDHGFTYFDTAYTYTGGNSEKAIKTALVSRYPRESFQLVSKLPVMHLSDPSEVRPAFETSLERTGAGYFDVYLLHHLNDDNYIASNKLNAWEFLSELKATGKAKKIGFSFHGNAALLERILTEHPEVDIVQLQINYVDWDSDSVQSRRCYEVARAHGKPVSVMEPIKGGILANPIPAIKDIFHEVNPDASAASWAIRFVASHEGLVTVLSGMSSMEQMVDNVSYMQNFQPLSEAENEAINKAVAEYNKIPRIPCTNCRYCVDDCPQRINIPSLFECYNNLKIFNMVQASANRYKFYTKTRGLASDCIGCCTCEGLCPQGLPIHELLAKVAETFE